MKKVQRITESDINRIVKKTIKENKKMVNEGFGPVEIGELVLLLLSLGYMGYNALDKMVANLRSQGRDDEANEIESAIEEHGAENGDDLDGGDTDLEVGDTETDLGDFDFDFDLDLD